MTTKTTAYVGCHYCNQEHIAERSGETHSFGAIPPRPRFAVVCDGYVDYYTDEVVCYRTETVMDIDLDVNPR